MHTGRFVTTRRRLVPKLFRHITCKPKLDSVDLGVMARRFLLAVRLDAASLRQEGKLMQKEARDEEQIQRWASATRRPLETEAFLLISAFAENREPLRDSRFRDDPAA